MRSTMCATVRGWSCCMRPSSMCAASHTGNPGITRVPGWLANQGQGEAEDGSRMQHLMLKLDRALVRRRWWVLGAWLVALAVALPLAMQQSEHLTGGGFGVPGSQSEQVGALTKDDFRGAGHAQLGAVVIAARGATPDQVRRAIARVRS